MIFKGEFLQKTPCKKVSMFEGIEIVKKLETELKLSSTPGIGLAAPQIGIDASVFILRIFGRTLDVINPVIKEQEDLRLFPYEGCLSFDGEQITTTRYNELFVSDDLHTAGVVLTGIWAVAWAHEFDHTMGLTMYDRQIKTPERNQKCFCGSGKKFKVCHLNKEITI